jgi:hypothetical protein
VVYLADWPVLKHAMSTVFAAPDCASRSSQAAVAAFWRTTGKISVAVYTRTKNDDLSALLETL